MRPGACALRWCRLAALLALLSASGVAQTPPTRNWPDGNASADRRLGHRRAPPTALGLPPGSGSVAQGEAVFAAHCVACHAATIRWHRLWWADKARSPHPNPLRTIGSYWPYASTVFDYVRRAMPFNAPGSLTGAEVYAVTAFLLNRNGIVPADAVMDATTLPAVRMPNRTGFTAFGNLDDPVDGIRPLIP